MPDDTGPTNVTAPRHDTDPTSAAETLPTADASHDLPSDVSVFDGIRSLGIVRPDDNRWGAGVAAGLARYWGVDPILVRGGFVVATVALGVGVLAYGLAWLLLPEPDGRIHAEAALHGSFTSGFFGAAFTTMAGLLGLFSGSNGVNQPLSATATVAMILGVIWLVRRHRTAQPATTTSQAEEPLQLAHQTTDSGTVPSWGTPSSADVLAGATIGAPDYSLGAPQRPSTTADPTAPRDASRPDRSLILLTVGAMLVIGAASVFFGLPMAAVFAAALGVAGLGIVISGLRGRRSGVLLPLAVILAIMAPAATSPPDSTPKPPGDHVFAPVNAAEARNGFDASAGELAVNLTQPALLAELITASEPVFIPINLISGDITIVVPNDVGVEIDATAAAGEIDVQNGEQSAGLGNEITTNLGSGPTRAKVKVFLGAGSILIKRNTTTTTGAGR